MKKVLVIGHLEPAFESSIDVPNLVSRTIKYGGKFDEVISVKMEGVDYPEIEEQIAYEPNWKSEQWIYGFDADYFESEGEDYSKGVDYIETNGYEYAYIEQWMRDLPKDMEYTLVGGARHECLEDVANIFEHLKLNYKINETYCYAKDN